MIKEEMERIGLSDIHKDELHLDSWEFKKAVMRYEDRSGKTHEFQLGGYQTEFHTDGFKEFSLTYLGRGTAQDYEGRDVEGKSPFFSRTDRKHRHQRSLKIFLSSFPFCHHQLSGYCT